MKISIIVPVYNVELYIRECLDSIVNQTYKNIEIIVVNDGSTDRSKKIVDLYQSLSNVIIINQDNAGLSNARNVGFSSSTGEYVLFLDSDDMLASENLIEQAVAVLLREKLDVLIFDYCIWDDKSDTIFKHDPKFEMNISKGRCLYDNSISTNKLTSVVWNKLVRSDLLLEKGIKFIDGLVFEDMVYTPHLLYESDRVMYLPVVGIMYRQRTGSIMSTTGLSLDRIMNYLKVAEYLYELGIKYNSIVLVNQAAYSIVLSIQNSVKLSKEDKRIFMKILDDSIIKTIIKRSSKLKYKLYYKLKTI